MTQLLARQVNTCTGNKLWYACSKGNYHGCCSVSPCDAGICPDDDNDSTKMSLSTTTTPLAQKTTSSTMSSLTTATATSAATTSSASQVTTVLAGSISEAQHATVSTTESSSLSLIPNPNSINGAVIGGVIAGGVVLLILLGLILYKTYQSRKKRARRFTLLRWRSVSSASDETGNSSTKPPSRGLNLQTEQRFPNNTQYNPNLSHLTSVARSMAPSYGSGTLISSHSNQTIPPRSYQTSTSSPNPTFYSTPTSTTRLMSTSPFPSQDENTTIMTRYHSPPKEREQRLPLIRTPIPRRKDVPHELWDTGFWRQRVELAAYPHSDLINIPLSQRRRTNWIIEEQDRRASTPPLPIMTPEGAVLAPNFEGGDGDDVKHVLSFMDDVPETETELPAYRLEWGRSFRDEKR